MNLALFDLDHTLLSGDSDIEWPKYLISKGILDANLHSEQSAIFFQKYKDGTLDIDEFLNFQLAPLARFTRDELNKMHEEYMQSHILPIISTKARRQVATHQEAGDQIIIITATNRFITAPIANELGVKHLIAVELEEDSDGSFNGRYCGVPSFQAGKITRLHEWLAQRQQSLSDYQRVWFYSDSRNDLPLLSLVSDPIAVDPDETLRAHAEKNNWSIISLRDEL